MGDLGLRVVFVMFGLANLDEVGVAVEPRVLRPAGGDVEGGPCGIAYEGDGGVADGFEACEAVDDLCTELGGGGFVGLGRGEFDLDAVFLRDAGDVGAGRFGVGGDADGADEAEIDDVAGEYGVVTVAEGREDVGLGEHLF